LGCGAILTLGDMTKPKANGGVDGVVENTLPDIQKNQKSQSR